MFNGRKVEGTSVIIINWWKCLLTYFCRSPPDFYRSLVDCDSMIFNTNASRAQTNMLVSVVEITNDEASQCAAAQAQISKPMRHVMQRGLGSHLRPPVPSAGRVRGT